jgi:alanine racemase
MIADQSWVEISRSALLCNWDVLERIAGDSVTVVPVVKANAYGHGLRLCAEIMANAGARMVCVNEIAEAEALNGLPLDVYVVGPTRPEDAQRIVAAGCQVVTASRDHVDAMARAAHALGTVVGVHVKVETGTHRQGLPPAQARDLINHIGLSDGVVTAGVTTHLADVEDETEHTFAGVQINRFAEFVETVPRGILRHCGASAAHLVLPGSRFDMVRTGIALYGLWPSKETRISAAIVHGVAPELRPALSWKTRIAQISTAQRGDYVGYGRSLRLPDEARLALLPVGYYDGYDRRLSGQASVLIAGHRAPVAGRVCMNMLMVDVTQIPRAEVGDEVVLLGTQGDETVSAEEMADWIGTINYEVVTRIHERLPRFEVD